jgi:hypothetical protein
VPIKVLNYSCKIYSQIGFSIFSIHMKFSMTGQEKGNLFIQLIALAGLTSSFLSFGV